MKRSQINYAIDKALAMAETFRLSLPEFASVTASCWPQKLKEGWQEVRDLQLGWDVTDFGSGCFSETGLTLLTLRNGSLSDPRYAKPYAEKMLQIQQDQQTPGISITTKWKTSLTAAAATYVCSWPGRRKTNSWIISAASAWRSMAASARSIPAKRWCCIRGRASVYLCACITVSGPKTGS